MKRFRNILLVHDHSSRGRKALERAAALATRNGARLTLLEVIEPPTGRARRVATSGGEVDLLDAAVTDRQEALAAVASNLDPGASEVISHVAVGTPFLAVIKAVLRHGHDLVLTTAEGRGELHEHLFGSTSRHLLRKCPCPVWVVRPTRRKRRLRVLAAVNPAEEHASGRELDRRILQLASSLATMYEGELDVVHAWHAVSRSTRVTSRVLASWNAEIMAEADSRLQRLLEDMDLADAVPRIHLPGGPPGLKIAEVAAERRCDVVVMGTLSRSGLKGLVMGNTCETVLQHLNNSVLAIKPEGFVSPLAELAAEA